MCASQSVDDSINAVANLTHQLVVTLLPGVLALFPGFVPLFPDSVALFPRFKAGLCGLILPLSLVKPPRSDHYQLRDSFSLHGHLLESFRMFLLSHFDARLDLQNKFNGSVDFFWCHVSPGWLWAAGSNNISLQKGFHASVFEMACLLERRALVVIADG